MTGRAVFHERLYRWLAGVIGDPSTPGAGRRAQGALT
jgi:hypothetical protein